jgi:hypothetical protein
MRRCGRRNVAESREGAVSDGVLYRDERPADTAMYG